MNEEAAVFNFAKEGDKLVLTATDDDMGAIKNYLARGDEFAHQEDFTMEVNAELNASASYDISGDDVKVEVSTK